MRLLTGHIDLRREAFRYARRRHPFAIEGIVVLPDHLHAIWKLPESDADFALRWRVIKSRFSRGLPRGERHIGYIHFNPVKHRHVARVRDWPYSSFHRLVRLGDYPMDWAGDAGANGATMFGER